MHTDTNDRAEVILPITRWFCSHYDAHEPLQHPKAKYDDPPIADITTPMRFTTLADHSV